MNEKEAIEELETLGCYISETAIGWSPDRSERVQQALDLAQQALATNLVAKAARGAGIRVWFE